MTHGWTFDQFDAAPFPQVLKQLEYWAEHPPTHELVAAFVGFKPSKSHLNRWEREAASIEAIPANAVPAYVLEQMRKFQAEKSIAN